MCKEVKRNEEKLFALALCVIMVVAMAAPAFAEQSSVITTENCSLATMTNGDEVIEVPVIRQTIAPRSSNGIVQSTVSVLIPDFEEETMERNAEYVQQIKETGSFAAPRIAGTGVFSVPGYITYTSTLNYNVTYYQGAFRLYDLISFKLHREIHSMAPFNSVNNATAMAIQVGSIGGPGDLNELTGQTKDYSTIQYDVTYSVPTAWKPVYPVGYYVGVQYRVWIDYAYQNDYLLEYTHQAT